MKIILSVLGVLVLGLAGLAAVAEYRWRAGTASLVAQLERQDAASQPATFSTAEIAGLPAPVIRYFRAVLHEGQPIITHARIAQQGEFLVQPDESRWGPFTAVEHFAAQPAGFVWDARIRMAPGLVVRVRDTFLNGRGSMLGSLMGLIRIVAAEGSPDIAAGALHRYLAEAVWLPTALLPSQGVVWTPLDDSSARATLSVAGITVSLDFHFGPDSLAQRVFTPERARDVGGRAVPTPWRGRFSSYEEHDGMRVPVTGEVEWLLPEGPQPYWRGRLTRIEYGYSAPH